VHFNALVLSRSISTFLAGRFSRYLTFHDLNGGCFGFLYYFPDMKTRLLLIIMVLLRLQGFTQEPKLTSSIRKTMNAMDTMAIRSHIAYLADDKLKGRAPGTAGYQMAVDYVVNEFKKLGLKPAGDEGEFSQKFNLRRSSLEPGSLKMMVTDNEGNTDSFFVRNDISLSAHPIKSEVFIKQAPVAFAGYGVDIPGVHNDYKDIDVRGKIVIVLKISPLGLSSDYQSYFTSVGYKMAVAKSKGAIGTIIVYDRPTAPPQPVLQNALNPEKTEAYGSGYIGNVDVFMTATNNFLSAMLLNSGKSYVRVMASLKPGSPQSFDIGRKLSIRYKSRHADIETANVIGMIPGSDPLLKQEYVVHTAHLDHIGIGRAVDGDSIYNGAHDNASGVASLLEIAKLYKKTGVKPKRSILITMVSAEESGLLGSAYFASHPSIPKSAIVANVNTDMPTVIAPMLSVVPLGATHSSLLKNVQYAAKMLNLDIQADPEPEQSFFTRSDQYSFVREHIPAVHCKNGRKTDIAGFDLDAYIKTWRAKYYHQPADQIDGWFRFSAAKTYIQLNFLISYSIAMEKQRPSWNNDAYF
jgi:hypothetical protein